MKNTTNSRKKTATRRVKKKPEAKALTLETHPNVARVIETRKSPTEPLFAVPLLGHVWQPSEIADCIASGLRAQGHTVAWVEFDAAGNPIS